MRHRPAALILVLMLSACSEGGTYPDLLPTDRILAEPAMPAHARAARVDPAPVTATTGARAEALQARAEALRGPVVGEDLRQRAGQ